jgi:hypothetical protein
MNISYIRAMLAFVVVGTFMFITAFMAIYPLVTETKVALNDYSDFFAKTASVYTGIIGVIIGFYFGKAADAAPKKAPPEDKASAG